MLRATDILKTQTKFSIDLYKNSELKYKDYFL